MATYSNPDKALARQFNQILEKYHPELVEHGVTVELLVAKAARDENSGEIKGPAIKRHGYAVLAMTKVNSHKDRVAGLSDARVVIDGDRWDDLSGETQTALLDRSLYCLELVKDKEGQVKTDDSFRPRLKIKLEDWHIGGFAAIAERHGDNSIEVQEANLVADQFGQLLFAFMEPAAAG